MKNHYHSFKTFSTPFYLYDLSILDKTLKAAKNAADPKWKLHYALKANNNPKILKMIAAASFGADCVAREEVQAALEAGFKNDDIVLAGVGKTDKEIELALKHKIAALNCESFAELQVINELAIKHSTTARVAFRINPNIEADTHKNITTGKSENKFGIPESELSTILELLPKLKGVDFVGLHFHIGSQIRSNEPFINLCKKVNELQHWFDSHKVNIKSLNFGGGLGINYQEPEKDQIPDFESYFKIFKDSLETRPGQEIHFEPGRSLVGQCGALITKVLYIKNTESKNFAIVDAGMTELCRPALYDAYHQIENLTAIDRKSTVQDKYEVVGPLCESTDYMAKERSIHAAQRGDLLCIYSTGAYAESFHMQSNLKGQVESYFA